MTRDERFCALDIRCIEMREEGEDYSYVNGYDNGYYVGYSHAEEDLKQNTCSNCKHCSLYEDPDDGGFCNLKFLWMKVSLDFGCNKFKKDN